MWTTDSIAMTTMTTMRTTRGDAGPVVRFCEPGVRRSTLLDSAVLTERERAASGAVPGAVLCAEVAETDEALAAKAAGGDRGAFTALIGRYEHRVYRFAFVRLGSEHDACEVAQETLMRAWKAAPSYRASAPYASWILSIAHNEIVNVVRRRRKDRRGIEARNAEPGGASSVSKDDEAEALPDVWRAAREVLEDSVFEIVWLRYAEDMEPRQIAVVTGRTPVGVRVLLHRARAKIMEALGPAEGEVETGCRVGGDNGSGVAK
jgi:RNA polymerase sigma-70 factor (ECF subfamily)